MNSEGFVGYWSRLFTRPEELLKAEKENESLKASLKKVLIIFAVVGIISATITSLAHTPVLYTGLVYFFLALLFFDFLLSLIGNAAWFALSKLLRGEGTLIKQYYLVSISLAPLFLAVSLLFPLLLLIVFVIIPQPRFTIDFMPVLWGFTYFVGYLTLVLFSCLVLLIYSIYLVALVLKEAHDFSFRKSLFISVIGWVFALFFLLGIGFLLF